MANFLVVGAGSIGSRHARNLTNMGECVRIFDINKDVASQSGYSIVQDIDKAF